MATITPTFTLTLRLVVDEENLAILDRRFYFAQHLYNIGVKEARKRLNKLYKDKTYKAIMKEYRKTKKLTIRQNWELKSLREKYDLIGLYSFEKYLKEGRVRFSKHMDADTVAKLSARLWKAVSNNLFSKGKGINYKRYKDFNSVEGKKISSGILFKGDHIEWKGLVIPFRIKKKDAYARKCLDKHRIKFCRIKRRWHKHQWRYYVELVLEGTPPLKQRATQNARVGIDIGPSTIAAVSDTNVVFKELNDGIQNIDNEIRRLNRKADRQRRTNNPQNYNINGTIRRNSKFFKRKWIVSNNLRKTYDKQKELYQKRADKLKQFQSELANQIVSMGNEIIVETMNFEGLKKRSSKTEISEKTKRFKKKKRFGNSIQIHAPAQFILALKRKLAYHGGQLVEINTSKMRASQFNHMTGEYMSSDLNKRWKELIPDVWVQRDLYSAFLLKNALNEEEVDIEMCNMYFEDFLDNHDRVIQELRIQKVTGKHFPACMGI